MMLKIEVISPAQVPTLVDNLLAGSRFFSVVNVKRDGMERRYLISPKAYRAEINGRGKPLDQRRNPSMRHIPDLQADASGGGTHWRTLNLATVRTITAAKTRYVVCAPASEE